MDWSPQYWLFNEEGKIFLARDSEKEEVIQAFQVKPEIQPEVKFEIASAIIADAISGMKEKFPRNFSSDLVEGELVASFLNLSVEKRWCYGFHRESVRDLVRKHLI